MREMTLPRCTAYLAIILFAAAMGTSSAEAQIGEQGDGFAREFRPDFLRRDLQLINDRLKLGQEQLEIVQTVLQDYIETFDKAALQARDDLAAAQPAQERLGWEIRAAQDQLRNEMEVLLEQLQQAVDSGAPPEQIVAMQTQIQARIESVRSEISSLATQAENLRQPESAKVAADMRERLLKWRQQRATLRDAFATDTALILDDDQKAKWQAVLLEIRRQRLLPEGELAGESIDLFNLLRQIGIESDSIGDLDAMLAAYATNLDQKFATREQVLDDSIIPFWLAVRSGDQNSAAEIRSRVVDARVDLRDLHLNTSTQFAETLGEEGGALLVDAYRRRAFAGMMTPSIGTRLLEEAVTASDIAPEARESLTAQLDDHRAQWIRLELDFQQVVLDHQPVALIARPAAAGGVSAAARAEQLMNAASDVLKHQDVETIERVIGILGETRFMELAAAPAATSFVVAMRDRADQGGLRAADRRAIRARLDRNGDGRVTADEIRAAQGGG